jgi:putative transposase
MGDKRKKHAPGFKAKVALDALRERESVREISTRYGVHSTQVNLWKGQLRDGATSIFEHPGDARSGRPNRDVELFEQIGRLKMELEWLKKKLPGLDD